MGRRLELQAVFEGLTENVYFQPPPGIEISYPAIIYSRDQESKTFADNGPYREVTRYQVSVIDPNPDSELPGKVSALPLTTFVRHFTTQSLYHDIYAMYF